MGLDLVQVHETDSEAVCKLLNYEKFLYELQKKEKAIQKQNRARIKTVKEIKFNCGIAENDIRIKSRNISKMLSKGNTEVKVYIIFRGRTVSVMEPESERILEIVFDEIKDIPYTKTITKDRENGRVILVLSVN